MTQQMNRATAETQKEIAEEEGLAPILCWVKALIDDVLADEFDSADLEFSWSTESSIDPQTQEAILSSYATKGILTINEARVALGREPLTDAAANQAMVLTGSGYVPLRQGASKQEPPAQKRPGIAKYNHYHDERGRFTTADGVGSAADHPNDGRVQVASNDAQSSFRLAQAEPPPEDPNEDGESDEENRERERAETADAVARKEQWDTAFIRLRALDPKNPKLANLTPPNWVPSEQDIADLMAEIACTPANPRGLEGPKKPGKWANQFAAGGWTNEIIDDAIRNGKIYPEENRINPGNGATRFVSPKTGLSVIIDNKTGGIIHVGRPNFTY
jgi:hypothetical protein